MLTDSRESLAGNAGKVQLAFEPASCDGLPRITRRRFYTVTKPAILDLIIAALSAELDTLTRAAKDAFAAATDPDSKAENKYDTRTLEASYVARGQAQRVNEVQESLHSFRAMAGRVTASETVEIGSLVVLATPAGHATYFVGPSAGGTEVQHEGTEVMVITPSSPLGQKLMDQRPGAKLELRPGWSAELISVS